MEQEERDPVAERVARNDAALREANERIHWGRVVADHGRYTVVEKIGEAAEVVVAHERGERTA